MITRFHFENFSSFRDPQELFLVSSAPVGKVPSFQKVAAIYGPNASGKTNVLAALNYVRRTVLGSRSWKRSTFEAPKPFALDEVLSKAPSRFEIDLTLDGQSYSYGFAVNQSEFTSEWLKIISGRSPKICFSREGKNVVLDRSIRARVGQAHLGQRLLLSVLGHRKKRGAHTVYTWLQKQLEIDLSRNMASDFWSTKLARRPAQRRALVELMKRADLGISGLDLQFNAMPADTLRVATALLNDETIAETASQKRRQRRLLKKLLVLKIPETTFLHRGQAARAVPFPAKVESNGTRMFWALAGTVLNTIRNGKTLCVDELDAGLHPLLLREIIKLFKDGRTNKKSAQLIFNSHDVSLLSSDLLDRDEIWFTEKAVDGSSRLYALSDFISKRREDIATGYMQGRYGAIPFLELEYLRNELSGAS